MLTMLRCDANNELVQLKSPTFRHNIIQCYGDNAD